MSICTIVGPSCAGNSDCGEVFNDHAGSLMRLVPSHRRMLTLELLVLSYPNRAVVAHTSAAEHLYSCISNHMKKRERKEHPLCSQIPVSKLALPGTSIEF